MMTENERKLIQVDQRLMLWAHWYLRFVMRGLGYTALPFAELIKLGIIVRNTHPMDIASDPIAEHMDEALQVLRQQSPALAKALHVYYVYPTPSKQRKQGEALPEQHKVVGVSYSCFIRRVQAAKQWLVGWLSARGEL